MRGARTMAFLGVFLLLFCETGFLKDGGGSAKETSQKTTSGESSLIGSWLPTSEKVARVVFRFMDDGEWKLQVGRYVYGGTYEIIGNQVQIVDTYCGTKLPGTYNWELEGEYLTLSVLEDPQCERGKFLPLSKWMKTDDGIWDRMEGEEFRRKQPLDEPQT